MVTDLVDANFPFFQFLQLKFSLIRVWIKHGLRSDKKKLSQVIKNNLLKLIRQKRWAKLFRQELKRAAMFSNVFSCCFLSFVIEIGGRFVGKITQPSLLFYHLQTMYYTSTKLIWKCPSFWPFWLFAFHKLAKNSKYHWKNI